MYESNYPPGCNGGDAWERIAHRFIVNPETDCWEWQGSKNQYGYGQIRFHRRGLLVHRVAYMHFNGAIEEGMVLDHLCRNHCCLNPAHLEAVTHRENIMRGVAPTVLLHQNGQCAKGHPMTPEYGHFRPGRRSGSQRWECRICANDSQNRRYHKNKQDTQYLTRRRASNNAYKARHREDPVYLERRREYDRNRSEESREKKRARDRERYYSEDFHDRKLADMRERARIRLLDPEYRERKRLYLREYQRMRRLEKTGKGA